MIGRPTTFTPETGDLISSLISEGQSLRKICLLDEMPTFSTVMLWVAKGDRGEEPYIAFSEQYGKCMDRRTEYWAEEVLDIADDDANDIIFSDEGKRLINSEAIARSRLRVDSRKWLMGKLKPKKYGDKQIVESTGTNTNVNLNAEIELPLIDADWEILRKLGWKDE